VVDFGGWGCVTDQQVKMMHHAKTGTYEQKLFPFSRFPRALFQKII
jgi:hypothetical protein